MKFTLFLVKILFIPHKIFKKFYFKFINIFHFYIPNLLCIVEGRVLYFKNLKCFQKVYVTGLGKVKLGKNVTLGFRLGGFYKYGYIEIQPRYKNSFIEIGDNVSTNNNIMFCAASKILIGKNTLIGQYVIFLDHDAHGLAPNERRNSIGNVGEIEIGENVWIGNNVQILTGTKIGNNSIVAAGAVVKGIFPENVILGGVPAKIIKNL